jgi:hypothetical protein
MSNEKDRGDDKPDDEAKSAEQPATPADKDSSQRVRAKIAALASKKKRYLN